MDQLKLAADHARLAGIKQMTPEAFDAYGLEASKLAKASMTAEHTVTGLQTELVFQHVVTSLGHVQMIKHEDSGDTFYSGDPIQVPDFRIVFADGVQRLVETKTVTMKDWHSPFALSDGTMQKLLRYANLVGTDLWFALYWDRMGLCTLNVSLRRIASQRPEACHCMLTTDGRRDVAIGRFAAAA